MDDKLMRTAMGRFATGVTIILSENEHGEVRGMTANAFMSVSLDPKLILISVDNRANMKSIIEQAGKFSVNILADNQVNVSKQFAGQLKEDIEIEFDLSHDTAVIEGSLVNIVCDVYDTVIEGDHTLFVGKVEHLTVNEGNPLIFNQGKYETLTKPAIV